MLHQKKTWLGFLALSLLASGTLLFYLKAYHAMELEDPQRARRNGAPIPVRTAYVSEESLETVIGATAVTAPSQELAVRVMASSQTLNTTDVLIQGVHVVEGDHVERGQLLFEVLDDQRRHLVESAQATFDAAKAQLERAKKEVSQAQEMRELELASARANLQYRQ